MRRREFNVLLGGAAVAACARPVGAQQPALPLIGVVGYGTEENVRRRLAPFDLGLRNGGYVDGQNVVIEYRAATPPRERWHEIVADFQHRQAAVIVAANDGPALEAKRTTSTIPIVFVNTAADPVKLGLVDSLGRPGGNVTGVAALNAEFAAKRFDLLCQAVPSAKTVAYLTGGPSWTSFEGEYGHLVAAAAALGRRLHVVESQTDDQLAAAFASMAEHGAGAVILAAIPIFTNNNAVAALAARQKLPAMYPVSGMVRRGGLMSYSPDGGDHFLVAADLVSQILKGAKPADLPVRMSTKFEFVINLRTAGQIGLDIPPHLLAFTTEVIE
jgi:putative tryptophan/tyrosine transport system substrate-binding protein